MDFLTRIKPEYREDERLLFHKDFDELHSIGITTHRLFQSFDDDDSCYVEDALEYEKYLEPEITEIFTVKDAIIILELSFLRRVGLSCTKKWKAEYWAMSLYFTHPRCPCLEKELARMTHWDHEMFRNTLFYDIGPFSKPEIVSILKNLHTLCPEIIIDPFYPPN